MALRRSDDVDVFARALHGDDIAFAEVYRRYHERVYAFCLSRLLSRDAAGDAAQEVFVRALSSNASDVTHPSTWLFGIARHVCIDISRRELRESAPRTEALAEGVVDSAPREAAEDEALSNQEAHNVLLALRRTSARYRSALILREIHGHSMSEVAETLGVSIPTSYTILSRARDSFGKAYADVLHLPNGCRTAVEMIYRQTGTGLSHAEKTSLDAHLESCPHCRRESRRATDPRNLHSLLPFLPAILKPHGLLARAAAVLTAEPWPASAASCAPAFEWSIGRIAAVALATATIVTAIGGGVAPDATPRLSSGHDGSAGNPSAPVATVGSQKSTQPAETRFGISEQLRMRLMSSSGAGRMSEASPIAAPAEVSRDTMNGAPRTGGGSSGGAGGSPTAEDASRGPNGQTTCGNAPATGSGQNGAAQATGTGISAATPGPMTGSSPSTDTPDSNAGAGLGSGSVSPGGR